MQDTVHPGTPGTPSPGATPEGVTPAQAPTRVLTRSRDRMLGGVAGGLAEYFDVDPTVVRLGIVLTALISGGVVLLGYVALWVIMPEPPASQLLASGVTGATPLAGATARGNGALVLGAILVLVGSFALLSQFPLFHLIGWGLARIWFPSMLILIGGALILARARE
ncbi:MAG: PspC domain-containing protein [Dehalococcoidia bacterium]